MSAVHGRERAPGVRMIAVGLVAACLGAAPLPAVAADPYRDVTLALGQGLLALFPAVEGYVVSSSAGEAYVDAALKDLLRPGMEMQIYRPGAEMIHPVTRQVLGSYEQDLGVLNVTEVRETYSRGTLDAAGVAAGIVPGDRVRISARRLRTLLHVAGAAPGIEVGPLAQALIARGEQSGRFAMIDEPAWVPSLGALGSPWESVRADPAQLRRLGDAAAADLLLLARIEPGPIPRVAVGVRSLRTGTMLGELSERWPAPPPAVGAPDAATTAVPTAAATAAHPAEAAPVAAAPVQVLDADTYTVLELDSPARALAAGNILGEGRVDVVLSDGARLSLYRWEGESLAWKWHEKGRGGRHVLSLDAADVDGDGRSEVIVSYIARGRVTSELRRWQDGALKVAATIDDVYLRSAADPGAPALMLGQRAGIDTVLNGRVEQYRLRETSIERVDDSALPRDVGIFGLALAPAGSPVHLYALDSGGHIIGRTTAGAAVWSSPRPYGGYPVLLSPFDLFGSAGMVEDPDFDEKVRAFQGRLLAEQSPGGVRLAVPRNFSGSLIMLPRQRKYASGEVVILEGPPGLPGESRRSRTFDGYVADLARADVDGDGSAEFLFTVNYDSGLLTGERARLVAWRLGGTRAGEK